MHIIEYRGYQIKPHKEHPSNYIIVTTGKGGKIPDMFSGLFTSTGLAKTLIDVYLDTKSTKELRNDKTSNQSGS